MHLTKQQALEAMAKGHKVKHRYFTAEEWMWEKDGMVEFEDGCRATFSRFWHTRQDECWQTGWSIVK
jgi:hypothetical protein